MGSWGWDVWFLLSNIAAATCLLVGEKVKECCQPSCIWLYSLFIKSCRLLLTPRTHCDQSVLISEVLYGATSSLRAPVVLVCQAAGYTDKRSSQESRQMLICLPLWTPASRALVMDKGCVYFCCQKCQSFRGPFELAFIGQLWQSGQQERCNK